MLEPMVFTSLKLNIKNVCCMLEYANNLWELFWEERLLVSNDFEVDEFQTEDSKHV